MRWARVSPTLPWPCAAGARRFDGAWDDGAGLSTTLPPARGGGWKQGS
eukprot:gene26692-26138_t